jgi:hypothetical protein
MPERNLKSYIQNMLNEAKAAFLMGHGWKEVAADGGGTCWTPAIYFLQTPLYFALDDAYALETVGEGIHAYAGQIALEEALRAEDLRKMDEAEAKYFAETGKRHGIYPNW